MQTILLVHGGWHDSRCWDRLKSELDILGYRCLSLDLPGHGNKPMNGFSISMTDYAEAVCKAASEGCSSTGSQTVTLVGHSMGGLVISAAAELAPRLFNKLIYLTAFVPRINHSERLLRLSLEGKKTLMSESLMLNFFRGNITLKRENVIDLFYHDCEEDLARQFQSCLSPESLRAAFSKVTVTDQRFGSIPKAYIECTDDRALAIETQRKIQTYSKFDQIHSIDTSHSPFLSAPKLLAESIHAICS